MKSKICFFSPLSYPLFSNRNDILHGGAELQLYLLSKNLSLISNDEIIFLVGNFKQPKIEYHEKIKLIRTIKLENKELFFVKIFKALKLFFQLIKLNPDVIITSTHNSVVGLISVYKKIFRKKHIHRTASLIEVNLKWINDNGLTGKIFKYGLENADIIFTQNNEHKELLKKLHNVNSIILKNILTIENKIETSKNFILWVSRFAQLKQPYLFLNLAKLFPEQLFVMICPHTENEIKDWTILKDEAAKIKNLNFIEKIEFSKIQIYFNQAQIFVNTSEYEGFPNTFLQAALGYTPIVSLNVNPDNFLNNYDCGFYCENNYDILVEKIKLFIQNPKVMTEKGINCYNYLVENHNSVSICNLLNQTIISLQNK